MSDAQPPDQPPKAASTRDAERAERLARQLRANLLRRKAQARSIAGSGTQPPANGDQDDG